MIKRQNCHRVQFETEKETQLDVRQNTAPCTKCPESECRAAAPLDEVDGGKGPEATASEHALKRQLFYQMSRITKDRGSLAFDDRLDVLAIGVAYWVEQMGQDEEEKMKELRDQELAQELEQWTNGMNVSLDTLLLGGTYDQAVSAASGKKGGNSWG